MLALISPILAANCGDLSSPFAPAGTLIFVSNVTTGGSLDIDGYGVVFDASPYIMPLELNETAPSHYYLKAGQHNVQLVGVATNCSVSGGASRTVDVAPEAESTLTFLVDCVASPELASQRIVFARQADGYSHLFAMRGDGSATQLTWGPFQDADPTVSPDGNQIAFTSNRDGQLRDIYVLGVNTGEISRLTSTGNASMPDWSPDGRQILYSTLDNNIWVWSLQSATAARLGQGTHPAWSPDGQRIAYMITEPAVGFANGIEIMNADGSGAFRAVSYGVDPIWSPDGSRIAFTSLPDDYYGGSTQACVTILDRADQNCLFTVNINVNAEAWSPDGNMLLVTRDIKSSRVEGRRDIFLVGLDGTNWVRLTADQEPNISPAFWPPASVTTGSRAAVQTGRR